MVDTGPSSGLYLLDGKELAPDPAAVPRYAAHAAISIAPAPAQVVVFAGRIVVFAEFDDGYRMRVFYPDLTALGAAPVLAGPGDGTAILSVHPSRFGLDGSLMYTTETGVRFFERSAIADGTALAYKEIVGPATDPFAHVLAADVIGDTSSQVAVVSEPGRTRRGLSQMVTPMFVWSDVRSGTPWPVQLTAAVSADPAPDVIGAATDGGLCMIDGAIPTATGQPGCMQPGLPTDFHPGALLLADLGGVAGSELVIVRVPPGGPANATDLMVRGGLHVDTATNRLTATAPLLATTAQRAIAVTTWAGAQGRRVVTIGGDGALDCFALDSNELARCR